jgi:hypothetical protein
VNLKIQKCAHIITKNKLINKLLDENNQLISIFVASIKTSSVKS